MFNIKIPKSIIPIVLFVIILNILRVIFWGKVSLIFILWNIFLAFIPFVISSLLLLYSKKEKFNKIILFFGLFLWLLFIPNAPYIITDFIHLGSTRSIPLIFDILLIFSSALIGLIFFFYSLFQIEQIIKNKYSNKVTSIIIGFVIMLVSFGVYLGRFLRFNSWDVFVNNKSLVISIWKILTDSSAYNGFYFYTGLIFSFLLIFYWTFKIQIKND
ncbi:MAG: DUF1361 domain-containing protein [Candidatus Nomurabacteria bacterium]|nr:DUF1361 domain-containing protein [Candidatus Nomurabacteria bacterium]